MSVRSDMPETNVLAIASHVVYGYVGNTMATFCMQTLGCEVSALHTVHFSNHTGYKQFKGTKTPATEIKELYAGLQQSYLTDFDVLLSGYAPSAEVIETIGSIAQELKNSGRELFWVMDPVMGDNGRLYVSQDVVPAYTALLPFADLILPNQFEAEVLSGIKITDLPTLTQAITALHTKYKIPHIIVTSVRFPFVDLSTKDQASDPSQSTATVPTLSIVGSTIRLADSTPRLFHITVPDIDAFFSGTGDMFAALMVGRLREQCSGDGLCRTDVSQPSETPLRSAWLCPDNVEPLSTPLARAAEKVCASMCVVLNKTKERMDSEMKQASVDIADKEYYLKKTKASEVRVVKFQHDLKNPVVVYKAEEVIVGR